MGSTSSFAPCPTGSHNASSPSCAAGSASWSTWRPTSACRDAARYPEWYGEAHVAPELLAEAVYGLPELFRPALAGATLVAAAGCYPTAAGLALAPLVRAGLVEATGIVVDAASGVSGAGRAPKGSLQFGSVDGDFIAYGLLNHRHTPEMEQILGSGSQVLFTPHLAPMTRGILATCYAAPGRGRARAHHRHGHDGAR